MRQLLAILSTVGTLMGALTACSGHSGTAGGDVFVSRFPVSEVILGADRNYRVTSSEGDTIYLDRYASIHWPENIGDADLKPLHDSLLIYCFADSTLTDPEKGIRRFVTDTSMFDDNDPDAPVSFAIQPIDSFPDDVETFGCWFENVTANILELDEEKITFQVNISSYLGGAHPVSLSRPFTFDLLTGTVLTLDNILRPGCTDSVMPVIIRALARQLDVPVSGLDRAGIFTSQLTYPGQPYICKNTLYFHYNPYDIAPYSSGMIDVAVYPYEVRRFLTPQARRLFDLGYN